MPKYDGLTAQIKEILERLRTKLENHDERIDDLEKTRDINKGKGIVWGIVAFAFWGVVAAIIVGKFLKMW